MKGDLLFQLRTVANDSSRAQGARSISNRYADARFQLSQEATQEGRYLHAPSPESRDEFAALEQRFNAQAGAATLHAERLGDDTDSGLRRIFSGGVLALAVAIVIFLALGLLLRRERRRVSAAWQQELARMADAAMRDALTGLRNHRAFQEDLARELQRVARSGLPLAVVVLDIDDLKTLNDAHGHQAGDDRLRAFADALRATAPGREFALEELRRDAGSQFDPAVVEALERALGAVPAQLQGAG